MYPAYGYRDPYLSYPAGPYASPAANISPYYEAQPTHDFNQPTEQYFPSHRAPFGGEFSGSPLWTSPPPFTPNSGPNFASPPPSRFGGSPPPPRFGGSTPPSNLGSPSGPSGPGSPTGGDYQQKWAETLRQLRENRRRIVSQVAQRRAQILNDHSSKISDLLRGGHLV